MYFSVFGAHWRSHEKRRKYECPVYNCQICCVCWWLVPKSIILLNCTFILLAHWPVESFLDIWSILAYASDPELKQKGLKIICALGSRKHQLLIDTHIHKILEYKIRFIPIQTSFWCITVTMSRFLTICALLCIFVLYGKLSKMVINYLKHYFNYLHTDGNETALGVAAETVESMQFKSQWRKYFFLIHIFLRFWNKKKLAL